ncbi:putative fatty acid methyltransferase [Georgfuchsia toluolica]|uniref:Fatty acid methyltransferase n=1 Tax=Georgfuchsia toluolica TaxID=424218 RepID=A0A916J472_9PROT|nr:class I SAM-dependent methyltransferase [Georgfuchsia toluolica]CAG4883652.1 putative fatty acid methyltransferase [Georgfuchsia toluolica]
MWKKLWIRQAIKRLDSRKLPLRVIFWDEVEYVPKVPEKVLLRLHSPEAVRALATPTLGSLARAYVEQKFDLEGDIRHILDIGEELCDAATARDPRGSATFAWLRHTRPADRRNIGRHYDVSNDFYRLWLDPRLVYSCAYFRHPDDSLERAQEQKLDLICRKLMLKPGERFLDIGCGWGALLFWAIEHYGVHGSGITLSKEQHAYVQNEIEKRKLGSKMEVHLLDYRELHAGQPFDKIASIGMFEHVGRRNLVTYFNSINKLLKPGGLVMNHGITAADLDTQGLRSGISEFVEQYVFPGGDLVHISRVLEALGKAGLECLDVESLRPHYAKTLWRWVERLQASAERARELVGEEKYRIWRIYMGGSAHAFSRGWMSLHQVLAGKVHEDGSLPYPFTRDHLYAE